MTTGDSTEPSSRPLIEWLLRKYPDTPKKRAKQWITAGRVSVNGVILRQPNHLIPDPKDALELLDRRATALDCGKDGWQIHPRVAILYLDAALAVVNKGPGLLSVPAEPDDLSALNILADFLAGKLRAYDRGVDGRGYSLPPPYRRLEPLPVHRLDQYTSGVFCMAMNPAARQHLIDQLKVHSMKREYVAYVEGRPPNPQGTWRNWLKLSDDQLRQFIISEAEGKASPDEALEAITHYEVITEFPLGTGRQVVSKLRVRLETGRKHQIRAQAAHAGFPLVGDRTYHPKYHGDAPKSARIDFPRQALHAEILSLDHPDKTAARMTWTAALPKDLRQLEANLRSGPGVSAPQIIIVGGGAAGFFAAITCAESNLNADVTILEKSAQFLSKVRISGGGRCNVTHACFDARDFATRFPRGEQPLIGPFQRFQARDTVKWFEARGVKLKTESDGRMFPVTDSSETIIDCLVESAKAAGVKLVTNCGLYHLSKRADGKFDITLSTSKTDTCDRILLATGGCRTAAAGQLAVSLGHTLEPPVPSLFTFHIATPWLHKLAGISVESAEVSIPSTKLRERGAVLVTHFGLSGPSVLRLSAWGARELHDRDYRFPLHINWLPHFDAEQVASELNARREQQPARLVVNTPVAPLSARLWEQLVVASGIAEDTRWSRLTRAAQHHLIQQLTRTELAVTGKSLNKDEFVTCGGVRLREVDFKTMESRLCPGLYFAGELLDIDGVTGGFNFQAAWTTGWIAGQAMAREHGGGLERAQSVSTIRP